MEKNLKKKNKTISLSHFAIHMKLTQYCKSLCGCSVAQLCLTLCGPVGCSWPGSSVHGIFQKRVLEQVASSSSRASSWPRDWTRISCIAGGFFTTEPSGKPQILIVKSLSKNILSSLILSWVWFTLVLYLNFSPYLFFLS